MVAVTTRTQTRTKTQTRPSQRRAPRLKADLKVVDAKAIRNRRIKRNALALVFIVGLATLFLIAFAHARLVSGQQDLDLINARVAELRAERAILQRDLNEGLAPHNILKRAEELGMVNAEAPVHLVPTERF